MTSKESSSNSTEHSPVAPLLEETVDFDHAEEKQQPDTTTTVASREEGDKTTSTKQQPAQQQQQQQRKSSQVSQQTLRHRNSSKKKSFSGQVAARLEQAVAQAAIKPVNRSADLVPLTHEYDKMKRRLRALITAAKQYHESMGRMHRSRMEVVVRLATVATGTPIHEKIGSNGNAMNSGSNLDLRDNINISDNNNMTDSLMTIHKLAYKQCRFDVMEYQDTVVAYVVEWERVITTRVDSGLDQVFELNARMNHYQTKVGVLRKKMHQMEKNRNRGLTGPSSRSTASSMSTATSLSSNPFMSANFPAKMEQKLLRNQQKLEEAWKKHEAAASTLCHLLEQVTRQGWKDLAPLVECMMEFESTRTSHDSDVFEKRLESLQVDLHQLVIQLEEFDDNEKKTDQRRPPRVLSAPALEVPIMLTSSSDDGVESDDGFDDEDEDSRDSDETTGSSDPHRDEETTSDTSMSSSSISSRTNSNSPYKSSSSSKISKNKESVSSSNNNNKGFGVRWPPTRVTAV